MEGPKILYLAWGLALAVVSIMSFNLTVSVPDFQGIADSGEVVINSGNAVEIKNIPVLPGQVVQPGDLLVELHRPELTLKINEISHDLDEVKNKHSFNAEEIKSKIHQLEAKEASEISAIDYKIKELTSRKDFNRELTSELRSIQQTENISQKDTVSSPIALEIESLKKARELTLNQINVEINALQAALQSPENSLSIQAQSLENELSLLRREQEKLLIHSQITGVIGSVLFKPGEKVSPFVPILTLYTKTPSYVKGYIHENIYNQVTVGQKVLVSSMAGKNSDIQGEVIGVGSRIVEYPERLRKWPKIQMWGREVQVRVSENNPFLLGEKVMVRSAQSQKSAVAALIAGMNPGTLGHLIF